MLPVRVTVALKCLSLWRQVSVTVIPTVRNILTVAWTTQTIVLLMNQSRVRDPVKSSSPKPCEEEATAGVLMVVTPGALTTIAMGVVVLTMQSSAWT